MASTNNQWLSCPPKIPKEDKIYLFSQCGEWEIVELGPPRKMKTLMQLAADKIKEEKEDDWDWWLCDFKSPHKVLDHAFWVCI